MHDTKHNHSAPVANAAEKSPVEVQADASIMLRLRESTKELHTRVERHPVQAGLLRGTSNLGEYALYLSQMYHAQTALDSACEAMAVSESAIRAVFRPYHVRAQHAHADLLAINHPLADALPASQRFIGWINSLAAQRNVALLGVLYVLEGSTNGGTFIAGAMRKTVPLPVGAGTAFLDPHGAQQRERWTAFKSDADALLLEEPARLAILDAASRTFLALESIFDDMAAQKS